LGPAIYTPRYRSLLALFPDLKDFFKRPISLKKKGTRVSLLPRIPGGRNRII
jgi:hypothetical protein